MPDGPKVANVNTQGVAACSKYKKLLGLVLMDYLNDLYRTESLVEKF